MKDYAIIMLDIHGTILSWNEGAEQLVGFTSEEIIGQHFSKFYTDEDVARHHPQFELYYAKEHGHYEEEGCRLRKDGSSFWAMVTITKMVDDEGRHIGFAKVTRDLTERKKNEDNAQSFRLLVQYVKDYAIYRLDTEGTILSWNMGAERLKGYKAEEVIGKSFKLFYLPEDVERGLPEKELEHARRFGLSELEGWRVKKDGSKFWASLALNAIHDDKGNLIGFAKITHDLTEKKIVEETLKAKVEERTAELLESEKNYRLLGETIPDIVWRRRVDGSSVYFNQKWYDYIGAKPEEYEKKTWAAYVHPDDKEITARNWSIAYHTGKFETEHRIRRKDGVYRWFLSRAIASRDTDGKILEWFGTATDIEEQKKTNQALQDERELIANFVATLTHDLRNPLSAARASAQLITRRGEAADLRLRSAQRIVDSIDRADRMIQDLLDARKIRSGQNLPMNFYTCELRHLIEEAFEELSSSHGNRFVLKGPDEIKGTWSCDGIRRVIDNLLTNAVKYGDPHEMITVTLLQNETHVQFTVHNWGTPLTSEQQKQLFEPFHRTESAIASGKKGWGLGLSLVKGIVQAHQGEVSVSSSLQEGTTFKVVLPRACAEEDGIENHAH